MPSMTGMILVVPGTTDLSYAASSGLHIELLANWSSITKSKTSPFKHYLEGPKVSKYILQVSDKFAT